jgi:hypothetical protein
VGCTAGDGDAIGLATLVLCGIDYGCLLMVALTRVVGTVGE